jgi:hypothetical protein
MQRGEVKTFAASANRARERAAGSAMLSNADGGRGGGRGERRAEGGSDPHGPSDVSQR